MIPSSSVAPRVKELHDQGVSWASVARLVGLPSGREAKRVYVAVFGAPTAAAPATSVAQVEHDFGWLIRVACRDRTTLFFSDSADDQAEAERICLTECPVLAQCQQWRRAMRPSAGVWAGRAYARA